MKKCIIVLLFLALGLASCAADPKPPVLPTEPTTSQVTEAPTTAEPTTEVLTTESTEAPTVAKLLLKLRQFALDPESYEGTEAEVTEKSLLLENLDLPETALKTYGNDPFLEPIAAFLEEELKLTLDSNWKFYIHYFTQEQDQGMLVMTYWVGNVIGTNRAITFPIENGAIRTVIYSYLDRTVDEAALLQKYTGFQNTHEQERINVLGEDFEICGESTNYTYNYRTGQLTYSYNIFYRHMESGIIDNTYGTEMVIE